MHRMDQLVQIFGKYSDMYTSPGSILYESQVILKGSPLWTCVILSNLCPNICLVPNYAWNGPIGLKKLGRYSDMYTSPGIVYEHKLS